MKSLADKLDVGVIALKPTEVDLEGIKHILESEFLPEPNLVYHIYKNRRGKMVGVKLWLHADLSTMKVRDLFVTDNNYKTMSVDALEIFLEDAEEIEEGENK